MKKILFTLFVLAMATPLFAQMQITGTVFTEKGEKLPGVNILIQNTSNGTVTDFDGNFTIAAKKGDILMFSFIGYIKEEVIIENDAKIEIILKEFATDFDEIVVVGYGSVKKSDLTGSISSVSVDNASESGTSSVNQLLQGRASGVYVKTNSGVPGGSVSIKIRGVSSMSADSEPLYVVDGMIIDGTGTDISGNDITTSNSLAFLSPEDIDRIEVLKDASATAIYGSRGANGVVLISTKTGKKGKDKITYSGSVSISQIARKLDILDGPNFARYTNDIATLKGEIPPFDGRDATHPLPENVQWIDWQDEIYQNALTQNHRIGISGGGEKNNYFISLGYLASDGIIKSTGFEKFDIRTNYKKQVNDRFSITSNISASYIDNDLTVGTDFYGGDKSMIGSILNTSPIINSFLDADGNFDEEMLGINNPYAWQSDHQDNTKEMSLMSKLEMEYKINDIFTYTLRAGVDYRSKERRRYFGRELFQGEQSKGLGQLYNWQNKHFLIDNLLFFKKEFNKHKFDGTIGITYDKKLTTYQSHEASGFIDDVSGIDALNAGAIQVFEQDVFTPVTYASALFRINYNFKSKYSLTATGRADGSSKFNPGNQWGFFPAFAGAYRISKEKFMQKFEFVSNLKLRMGWGQVGNSSSPAYATQDQFVYAPGSDANGASVMVLRASVKGNPNLTWETSQQTNAGIDVGLWEERLTFSVDAYHKTTKDQLQRLLLPASSGFEYQWINIGEVENKGIEFQIDGTVYSKGDFKIDLGGNISFNRNKILEVGSSVYSPDILGRVFYLGANLGGNDEIKAPVNAFIEGQPVGVFWGFKTDGIIQDATDAANSPTFYGIALPEGNIKFQDITGVNGTPDGNVDGLDKTVIGDPNPDFVFALNGSVSYKNFSLDFLMSGVYGRELFNANYARLWNHIRNSTNKTTNSYTEAWTPEKPSNTFPRIDFEESSFNSVFTDRWVEDASFLKLNHVTLAYTFKPENFKYFESLKVYLTATNVFTITNYTGYDPEADSFAWDPMRIGIDFNSYPSVRSAMFGINLTF